MKKDEKKIVLDCIKKLKKKRKNPTIAAPLSSPKKDHLWFGDKKNKNVS